MISLRDWQQWRWATMANFGNTLIRASVREISGPASHITEFAGRVEPREKKPPVRIPDTDPARIAPETPADRVGPSRGIVIGVLLGAALWAVILGTIFLLRR